MKRSTLSLAAGTALLALALPAFAAHPGEVDLASLDKQFEASPAVAVTLDDWMLNFGARAAADDDQDLAALKGLEKLQVRIYKSAGKKLREVGEHLAGELMRHGWQPVVRVVEDGERVHVLIRPDGDNIAGLTVLATEDDGEAIFVNAYGSINPRDLAKLVSHVDSVHGLEGLDLAAVKVD